MHNTYMPSVLVELGFLTNNSEEEFLNSKEGQTYMASAIFRAIKDYKIEMDALILENQTKEKDNNELFFSIQFISSISPLNIENFEIENKDMIYEFHDNSQYKYSYGKVRTLEEVSLLKKQLIFYGFKDSFTIAILNGQKMSLSDALSILN